MNNVSIIGNITRDIELQYTQSGMAIAKFGIAVNKKVKNQQGGYDDKAHFFDITAFAKTAENVNQYFRKGSKIGISGELNFEQWEDQQTGQKRSKVSIICNQFDFIDKKEDGQPQQQQQQNQGGYNAPNNNQNANAGYNQPAQSNNAPQQQQQSQPQQQQMNYGDNQQQQQDYRGHQGSSQQNPSYGDGQQQQSSRQPVDEDEIPF